MKHPPRIVWIALVVLVILLGTAAFIIMGTIKLNRLAQMSSADMISFTTAGRNDAVLSVGIIHGAATTLTVYGGNGVPLEDASLCYEIGSISKTMTGSLLCKALAEERIALNDPIDRYLSLKRSSTTQWRSIGSSAPPSLDGKSIKSPYPTILALATHTSGYRSWYFHAPMIRNRLTFQRNDYYGMDRAQLLADLERHTSAGTFQYSNYGISLLGAILSEVYQTPYETLMNDFLATELKLPDTHVAQGEGTHDGYWDWREGDAYLPAGGILSTAQDMMTYLRLQMSLDPAYLEAGQHPYVRVSRPNAALEKMHVRTDAVGITWMIDQENGFYWHNGGTGACNSYIAFDAARNLGVVVLSNLPPKFRIPATVIGAKLMLELQ